MDHIAVDLGGRESQICVRSSDGTVLEERRCPTSLLRAYLSGRPKSRVVVETCSEAFGVADAAAAGHIEASHFIESALFSNAVFRLTEEPNSFTGSTFLRFCLYGSESSASL